MRVAHCTACPHCIQCGAVPSAVCYALHAAVHYLHNANAKCALRVLHALALYPHNSTRTEMSVRCVVVRRWPALCIIHGARYSDSVRVHGSRVHRTCPLHCTVCSACCCALLACAVSACGIVDTSRSTYTTFPHKIFHSCL